LEEKAEEPSGPPTLSRPYLMRSFGNADNAG
jgi:hypothetical protein